LAVAFFAVRRLAVAFLGGILPPPLPRPFQFYTDYSFFTATWQEVKAAKPVPVIRVANRKSSLAVLLDPSNLRELGSWARRGPSPRSSALDTA
jgi:hypothetical protein